MTLYEMLKHDEGIKLDLYKDTEGYYTIGVGHLVTKSPNRQEAIRILGSDTITHAKAEQLFNDDIKITIKGVLNNSRLSKLYNQLEVNRQYALVNMCYQMGVQGVSTFNNSLSYLEQRNWSKAAANLRLSKWHKQTSNRANRVISVFETNTLNAYN